MSSIGSLTPLRNGKISETLFTVNFGTNSTYEHSHMPKINSSSVKICESSRPRLARLKELSPYLLTRDPGSSASSLAICLVL
jgi:hypothetical protein